MSTIEPEEEALFSRMIEFLLAHGGGGDCVSCGGGDCVSCGGGDDNQKSRADNAYYSSDVIGATDDEKIQPKNYEYDFTHAKDDYENALMIDRYM
jgi:hypothetical protein